VTATQGEEVEDSKRDYIVHMHDDYAEHVKKHKPSCNNTEKQNKSVKGQRFRIFIETYQDTISHIGITEFEKLSC